ncbi:uncharacterized protein LOC123659367 [Melitaea cinxia]|uniref:uncharacterized protein LOC123659367 n=1 Tax=Melitaea cinxia TaxID=113334 RepID=UPI001E274497|nr:uncharacterized protein LOC123659367 [Melitaea cinxia]
MAKREFMSKQDRSYDVINFKISKKLWYEALSPTPVLKSSATVTIPIHVAEEEEENEEIDNEVEEVENEATEVSVLVDSTLVSDEPISEVPAQVSVSSDIANVTQQPVLQDEITEVPSQQVDGQVTRFPCTCARGQCGCCTGTILERFRMKACGNLTFVPEDFVFDVRLTVNNNTVVRRRVSASDPPPICFNPRRAPFVRVCAEISNIRIRNGNAFACLDINADIARFPIYSASFRCFGLGSSGLQTGLKPKPVSSGPKPVSLFGSGNTNDGTILDAAGSLIGGNSGGIFGGGNGPLDAIGNAVGDFFGGRENSSSEANIDNSTTNINNIEVPDSPLMLLDGLSLRQLSTLSYYGRQNPETSAQNSTSSRRCSCSLGVCKCCTGYLLDLINQKACMKITYHPGDFAFDVAMSMNDRILYENSVSGKNPRPICISPPRISSLKVCAKFYNVFFPGRNFHFCLAMSGKWRSFQLFNFVFDCLRMGANGIVMIGPEENGGIVVPNPQGGVDAVIDAGEDDIEDYDENVVKSLLDIFDK